MFHDKILIATIKPTCYKVRVIKVCEFIDSEGFSKIFLIQFFCLDFRDLITILLNYLYPNANVISK